MSNEPPPNHRTHEWRSDLGAWVKRQKPMEPLDFDSIITDARTQNYRDAGRPPTHAEQHQSYLLYVGIGFLVVVVCVGLWAIFGK